MTSWTRLVGATLSVALWAVAAAAQTPRTEVPAYTVRFLGAGTAVALNARNVAVGFRDAGGVRVPVIFDGAMRDLPLLAGTASCEAVDLNDAGLVVGTCGPDLYSTGRAVVWTPGSGGYTASALPQFAGDLGSAAAAVNNLGDIVGVHHYRLPTGLQVAAGVLWRPAGPPIELNQTYGMNDFPADINDAGQVVAGQRRLDLTTGVVTDLGVPAGPPAYIFSRIASISPGGVIAATAIPASSSSPQRLARYRNGAWQVLGGWGSYDGASGGNDAGTVVGTGVAYLGSYGSARQAVVWFDQMGALLYVNDVLVEAARDWMVLGVSDINDDATGGVANTGRIVGLGTNLVTGAYGAVLLEPAGALPVPATPTGLSAVPREATWQQPYHAIGLAWTDTSRTDYGFRVERSPAGQNAWADIARVIGPVYEDTTGTPGAAYDYRVRAVGLAGDSAPSTTARATFPGTPVDTTAPTATFVTPADGATVSGTVTIVVDTIDNVGVSYVDVQYQPNMGLPQICSGSGNGATSYRLTCSWNTRGLAAGSYILTASVSDAMGNGSLTSIRVQVGGTTAPTARVTSVALSASTRRGVTTVVARATVVDQHGVALRNAAVSGTWTTPTRTTSAVAATNRSGVAAFSITGGRGTYRFTVQNVVLAGYTFDLAGSQVTGTITVP